MPSGTVADVGSGIRRMRSAEHGIAVVRGPSNLFAEPGALEQVIDRTGLHRLTRPR